ncbi:dynein axonemal intermediate chain 1-like isoform X2 [Eriocheir sinensis]|uniref:dynein axonemal intermediate chain 1-like isoform X2 n=1 Tax=Eriocheir sinensis TaxID=95602 RepID=UPI0021C7B6C0|nr:dynein axonemal intermediate chain 1-like isoform X2 [Eriocheir sinensis]
MEEVYKDMVSQVDLAKLDSQPNPFNFSERVSQTNRFSHRNLAVQTEAPPSTTFAHTVGPAEITEAYSANYELLLDREMEREREEREEERERDLSRERGGRRTPSPGALDPLEVASSSGRRHSERAGLAGLGQAAKVVERMVNQNTYDDICQDFRYWEDGSDEFRPLEGSLLPLWKFHHDRSRLLVVTDLCWSPIYPDLFAAAYAPSGEGGAGPGGVGMLCLYSLKNPSTPERVFRAPCGVTCLAFHPKHGSVFAAGWADGSVVVYEARRPGESAGLTSCTGEGKHLLPVTQVRWVLTEPGEDLCLYSVAQDGRLTQWQVHSSVLIHTDLIQFRPDLPRAPQPQDRVALEGIGTCVAFRPDNEKVMLVGVDTGAVFQCTTSDTAHSLIRYPAHTAPVRQVLWNPYHNHVFVSCSVDWTVKVWLQYNLSPLIVLDLGGAVSGVAWSPFNSSVVVALSDEGRVYVYDLFMRRAKPLCVQSLVQRRRAAATCVSPSPSHPVLLVGGERGNLICLKLSPNLRRVSKDTKSADERTAREIELSKMERLIATNKG